MFRLSDNIPEPMLVSFFDLSVNIEIAYSLKALLTFHSFLDEILILKILKKFDLGLKIKK